MALTPIQRKKLQRYLMIGLIVVVFITAFVLWRGFFTPGETELPEGVAPLLQKVELDTSVFDHPAFEDLKAPREAPSIPSGLGRDNPFFAP